MENFSLFDIALVLGGYALGALTASYATFRFYRRLSGTQMHNLEELVNINRRIVYGVSSDYGDLLTHYRGLVKEHDDVSMMLTLMELGELKSLDVNILRTTSSAIAGRD